MEHGFKENILSNTFCVYKHTFPNRKVYIGITSQATERRWRANGDGYKSQEMVSRAIKKYGWENVTHEIIADGISQEEAERLEIYYINKHKSNQRKYGYNIESGGRCAKGHKLSAETRKRMSEARKGDKNHNYGKHLTEETRKKLSAAHMGKCDVEAVRRGAKKRMGANAYNARGVRQCTIDGKVVAEYASMADAQRATGTRIQDIRDCCIGRYKKTHGYRWEFLDGVKNRVC